MDLTFLIVPLWAATFLVFDEADRVRKLAIRKSRERRIATVSAIAAGMIFISLSGLLGAACITEGDYGMGGAMLLVATGYALLVKSLLDDDDWFDDQKRRLRRRLRKLSRKFIPTAYAPRPA